MRKIIVFLLLFCSCVSNSNKIQQDEDVLQTELPYIISLEKEIDNIQLTGLSEIGSTITYIPLETNSLSLLKELKQVIVTDSCITVFDKDKVLMFNNSGHFLKQFGRNGQGPGEYNSPSIFGFCFSHDYNKLYVLTARHVCFEFDMEGKFLNSYKLDSVPNQILPLKDDLFVFYCLNVPEFMDPIGQSLIISDLNNNIQKTYKNYHKRVNKPGMGMIRSPLYYFQDNVRFQEFGVDTLYTITEEELIPHAIFHLGKSEMPSDLHIPGNTNLENLNRTLDEHLGKYLLFNILEDVNHFYLTLFNFRDNIYGYYNKHNNTVKIFGEQGFQNNIDGGLTFFPKYIYNDSILVDYVNAFTLREHVLKSNATEMRRLYGQKYDDLVKLANSLDDDSNPIVVMVNL